MATTNFVNFSTPAIDASWLNEINRNIYSDVINVRNYLTTAVDGVTSNQAGIEAAVAAALANGAALYWPNNGSKYVSTANIPSFHNVIHVGQGQILRGTDTFYIGIKTGQTNRFYVATTGSDTNDGLASTQPFLTTQAAGDKLYNWPSNNGTWIIQHAAGSYTQIASFSAPFPSYQRVQFLGAAVNDGVQPTTIFLSPGGANRVGLYVQRKISVYVEDIDFRNYADTGTPTISGAGSGFTADAGCDVLTRNVWASNNDVGIEAASETKLRVRAGVVNLNGVNIRCISHVTHTIGYLGTAADPTGATGTAITNGLFAGFAGQESSTGHLDYCYLDGNVIGMDLTERSRVHLLGSTVTNHTTAVRARGGSSIFDNAAIPNTFTSNTTKFQMRSDSYNVDENNFHGSWLALSSDPIAVTTSSTGYVTAKSITVPAFYLEDRGAALKLRLSGDVVGTAGTKSIRVSLGATILLTASIAATTTEWCIDVLLLGSTDTSQIGSYEIKQNGVLPVINGNLAIAENTTTNLVLLVEHLVANAADTNRIAQTLCEVMR